MNVPEMPDAELLQSVREGLPAEKRQALDALHTRYGGLVSRYIARRVEADEQEDLKQSVWEAVVKNLVTSSPRASNLLPWILGIARNKVADHFRATYASPVTTDSVQVEQAATSQAVDEGLEDQELNRLLRWGWANLTPEQRLVLLLCDVLGGRVSEVVRWTGRPRQSIYSMRGRAKEELAELVQGQQGEGLTRSRWLRPEPYWYLVGDLSPTFSDEEAKQLARALTIEAAQLEPAFEKAIGLQLDPATLSQETLDEIKCYFFMIPREEWTAFVEVERVSCQVFGFYLVLNDEGLLTLRQPVDPFGFRMEWRRTPENAIVMQIVEVQDRVPRTETQPTAAGKDRTRSALKKASSPTESQS